MDLKQLDVQDKRVLVRVDFNVPVKDGKVTDVTRIEAARPTIDYLLDKGASVILMSHRGRPKGTYDEAFSMEPVLKAAEKVLDHKIIPMFSGAVVDENVLRMARELKPGEIGLLENLRFRNEEKKNDDTFADELASLADCYVNDAFGTAHRAHASNVGIVKKLPAALGFLMGKEVRVLSDLIEKPKRPFMAILGGAKVSDKISVIDNLMNVVDEIFIVGAMANTFLLAKGHDMGASLVEADEVDHAKELMAKAEKKGVALNLPVDLVVAKGIDQPKTARTASLDDIQADEMALDIGEETVKAYGEGLKQAKSVVWNGPAGVFETAPFDKGTVALAKILGDLDAEVVIGGGDSAAAIKQAGLEDAMSHISSGGGASLEFLEGKVLPAIAVMEEV
ncbi:phosphoglycerate kinase [Aedoeadaptatus acetigenes]|uniref:phosphoglycerate kinase n=1 Tax=Aedoeadaptatus acetigenes TaxID=2981723 RepID=UPI0011DD4969|nr:phosphoglycerate kinase [Aedoeadaptatus acetigenes]MCU6786219.1 phosphoglycerate kinase [Aedoeadaptatus acetigenes]